jgi:aminopeptidase N/puromycin-sensitive aminopeptidase
MTQSDGTRCLSASLRTSNIRIVCVLLGLVVTLAGNGFAERQPRLPSTVVPEHYQLKFAPNLAKDSFAGEETIDVQVQQPVSSITLNAAEITFQETTITSAGVTQTAQVSLDAKSEMATLTVDKALAAGSAQIHIVFTGILNDKLRGFYRANANGRKYAVTQFEASDARRAFPCFDEPAVKATFSVSLIVDSGDTAISNGTILRDTPGPEAGKHTLVFSTTARMSSYLVAMAVGDFQCVEGEADGIPIRVCATPDKKEQCRFALEAAEHILQYFDKYFEIKYPFGKLDIVAAPEFAAGAMENTGAIFYRERLLLIDDKTASLNAHQSVTGVLAHEMAHQWFGDLVTMSWWNDLWLNEGFATWMGGKPIRAWKPDWASVDVGGPMDIDSIKSPRPVRSSEGPPPTDIVYGKASNVLRMMEAYEGEDVFRAGVNAYLKAHAFGSVTAEDFWNAQTQASGKPIDKIMATFIDQPGVPLIQVEAKAGDRTTVTLTQRRFFRDRAAFAQGSPELWEVPVCLRSAANVLTDVPAVQCVLLTDRTQTFKFKNLSPPVMANAGQKGYYRVMYAPEVLNEFSRTAETKLTPAERIGLASDEWAMVSAGMIPVGSYLSLVEGLKSDRRLPVVSAYAGRLETIDRDMVSESEREGYRAWVRSIFSQPAQELGWQPRPGESVEQPGVRAIVLSTLGRVGRDPEVLETARTLARKYIADPLAIDPSLADTVVSLAALEGDAALYDEFLAASKTAKSPEEYYRFLFALARFSDPALLTRTLEYALTPDVRGQDFGQLMGAVMTNPSGTELAWKFARQHWDEINSKPPGNSGGRILTTASVFCDVNHGQEVKEFFTQKKSDEGAIQRALEDIGSCTEVKNLQEPNVAVWFQHHASVAGK